MTNSVEINTKKKKGNIKYFLFLILLIFILLSKAIFFEFYRVNSVSMMDTLLPNDFVLINKLSYGAKTPNKVTIPFINFTFGLPSFRFPAVNEIEIGDIIVIDKQLPTRPEKYIKRCVAGAGQTIEIKNGEVLVNGMLVEIYNDKVSTFFSKDQIEDVPPFIVPLGFIFVLGDNRGLSYDSRSFGLVEAKDVIVKAFIIYSSIDGNGDFRWSRFFRGVE
ncbi:MAG: signal peptidase I [Candidatus Delongbacteria bacterium]|nr:signal peptidase I [Candidatus Delongbacteria bacterium]